jgi:Zn-dependent metalloprotease
MHSSSRNRHLVALTPLAFALVALSAQAANRVDLHKLDVAQVNHQYALASANLGAAALPRQKHAEMLGLDANSSLQQLAAMRDSDGTVHYRYQQTFRGVPIFGEHVIVSETATGAVRNIFGRAVNGLAGELPATAPSLGKAQALSIAKAGVLASHATAMRTEREDARQMIYVDDANHAHMTYVVSFFADSIRGGSPTRPFVIVDANSGKVLKKWEGLTTALVGTGPGGNTKTGQYEWGSGGKYGYLDVTQSSTTCTMNNTNVKSVNLNGGTTGTTAFSYTCPRNTYKTINGGYSPINDAHYFGGVITKMYPAYTGYNALTFQLVMRVHYSSAYENAFWDGSTMSFGDGASTFYPLTSVDVAGHEVSHGFTEQHSNLTYSGQSGGMNEAFSDMGGEATENYWKGTNDFLVGPEVFKASGALRYMCNPTQDGASIDNAANYTSSLDVHNSSGVYNKAFCNLAKTTGWTTASAFKVMARANALYWTPSSTFVSGACGVMTAATDVGLSSADVAAAFATVGVSTSTCSGGGGGGGSTGGALTKGVTVTGIGASTGASVNYTLVVPSGATNLVFTQSGGTGDSDMYVKFGSAPTDTVYDCRPYVSGNAETCTFAAPSAGTYYVRLKAYSTFSGVSLKGDYTTGSTGGTQTYTNSTATSIPDVSTITSTINVSGRSGNAPTTSQVAVNITHTYRGDLKIDLLAPDGSVYALKAASGSDSADNVVATYTVNLSTELLNGAWKLRVQDTAAGDVGTLNSWSVTF